MFTQQCLVKESKSLSHSSSQHHSESRAAGSSDRPLVARTVFYNAQNRFRRRAHYCKTNVTHFVFSTSLNAISSSFPMKSKKVKLH